MHRTVGSLATVYMYFAPGQYLELFSGGIREGLEGQDVIGFCHICVMTKDIHRSYEAVKAAGGVLLMGKTAREGMTFALAGGKET